MKPTSALFEPREAGAAQVGPRYCWITPLLLDHHATVGSRPQPGSGHRSADDGGAHRGVDRCLVEPFDRHHLVACPLAPDDRETRGA